MSQTFLLMSSSKFFTEKAQAFFDRPLEQERIAYITTAAKGTASRAHSEECIRRMTMKEYRFEEIDIEGKDEFALRKMLKDKTMILVAGGNTFYLLKHVKESGFDIVVKELVDQGVVYAGSSAGVYIACPTIEMATWKGRDSNHVGLTDLTAMNLVPFLIVAHYEPEQKEIIEKHVNASKYPVKILTDEQALLVADGKVTQAQ